MLSLGVRHVLPFLHILYNQALSLIVVSHLLIQPEGVLFLGPVSPSWRLNMPGKPQCSPHGELGADPTCQRILYHRIDVCSVYNHIGHDTRGTHVAEPMGPEEPPTACGVPLSSMAKPIPPSVPVKSWSEPAARYCLSFGIQALTECLFLLAIV